MSTKPSTIDPYSRFFKEDVFPKDVPAEEKQPEPEFVSLKIEQTEKAPEESLRKKWAELRQFFISNADSPFDGKLHSIHLPEQQFNSSSPTNFPFIINRGNESLEIESLSDWLNNKWDQEEANSSVFKNLIPYLVNLSGQELREENRPLREFWKALIKKADKKLGLKGAEQKDFKAAGTEIEKAIVDDARILGYSPLVMIPLLQEVLRDRSKVRKEVLAERINEVLPPLMDILEIERENDPSAQDEDHLKSAMSFGDHYFDFKKLAGVLPESSSEHLPADRLKRIQDVIKSLEAGKGMLNHNATVVVEKDLFPGRDWEADFAGFDIQIVPKGEVCQYAQEYFEEHIQSYSEVIKSLRIGKLEKAGKYNAELHDEIFSAFNWNLFSEEEMDLTAPVLILADSTALVHEELPMFSRILGSDMPVKAIGFKFHNEFNVDPLSLAMAHRNTYVAQLTSLDPVDSFNGLQEGISNYSPSFIQFRAEMAKPVVKSLIKLSASLESREFPVFSYNGKLGTPWGSRFKVAHNPDPDKPWPIYTYEVISGNDTIQLESAFTMADYCTLEKDYQKDFMMVSPEFWTDDLIQVDEYLKITNEERYGKLPFIWLSDKKGSLHRAVVSLRVIHRCEDIQDFWSFLQDSGGIHSFHAENALKEQEKVLKEDFENRLEELKQEFDEELKKVASESAAEAMDHLTAALLDLEPDSLVDSKSTAKKESGDITNKTEEEEIVKEAEEKQAEPEIEKQAEIAISEDPWIETALCTNCNECIDINSKMFSYNDNKLAYIADAAAGTFAQLVEAAEKCPVHIIHPGKPLNPDEPDLQELIERAKKFN